MKFQYKLGLVAAGLLAMSSCANHDLIPDITTVGQAVPTCYWELGSTVCKAGDSFSFQGKYTVEPGKTPDRSEIWYQIVREDVAAVTAKLGGSALNYTQTATLVDTMRSFQSMARFAHSEAEWDGHEFLINGVCPVSRTLSPVSWVDVPQWDQARYESYYPEGFTKEFTDKVIDYLTGATADSYYGALRAVYLNYAFTNEQMTAIGLPAVDQSGDDKGASEKSDLWFTTTEASDDALVGYYYITVEDGKNVNHEVPLDYQAAEGQVLYPVYKSSPWVFCRYDDNKGAIVSTVREEWLPKFATLLAQIPFQDWIYDTANSAYKVDFARKYTLKAQFRVYDTDGNEGIASDEREITIN